MAESSGEKKHPATENRLRILREQGQVAVSRELASAALLGTLAVLWPAAIRPFGEQALQLARTAWQPERLAAAEPLYAMNEQAAQAARTAGLMIGVVLLAMFCVAGLARFLQVGPMFSVRGLWQMEKLNPATGFKNIFFSGQTYRQAALGLLKAALVLGLVTNCIWSALPNLLLSMRLGALATVRVFDGVLSSFLWEASALYAVFAGADYLMQRQSFAKRTMMTDEELKQDQKDTDGNPEMKMHLRHLNIELMQHAERERRAARAMRKPGPRTIEELFRGGK